MKFMYYWNVYNGYGKLGRARFLGCSSSFNLDLLQCIILYGSWVFLRTNLEDVWVPLLRFDNEKHELFVTCGINNDSLCYFDCCSDYLFKLLLIGDSGVGKSCLLLRFAVSSFLIVATSN